MQTKRALDEASELVNFGCVAFIGPWASGPSIELVNTRSIKRGIIGYSAASPRLSEPGFSHYVRVSPVVEVKLVTKLIKGLWLGYSWLCCDAK